MLKKRSTYLEMWNEITILGENLITRDRNLADKPVFVSYALPYVDHIHSKTTLKWGPLRGAIFPLCFMTLQLISYAPKRFKICEIDFHRFSLKNLWSKNQKKKINNIVVTQFLKFIGWYSKWVLTVWKTPHSSRRHQQNVKLWNPKNLKYIRLWCSVLHTVVFNRPTDPKTMDDNFFIDFFFFFKS